jgi:pyruvate-formate lyase-activating enzyme
MTAAPASLPTLPVVENPSSTEVSSSYRWKPNPDASWIFYIDIVSGCNLACPSCPVGNSRDVPIAKGYMAPELLEKIVTKAIRECKSLEFGLYNWTEPFLHPDLPAMIRTIRSREIRCSLSTNLNIMRNVEGVLRENPNKIKISLSGFRQETYSYSHKNGDIERVKRNLAELAETREKCGSTTDLVVGFHRYLGNHEDEQEMRELAGSLGIGFEPQWAYLMPLEKVMAYVEPSATSTVLQADDRALIDKLALKLDDALAISSKSPRKKCQLRDQMMSLNVRGEVMLCCVVYDQQKYGLGSYLDLPLEKLQDLKYQHWQCAGCMSQGLHKLFTYEDKELDEAALANVHAHYPDAVLPDIRPRRSSESASLFRRIARRVKRMVKWAPAKN